MVISVAHVKGGAGKTTLATNLAIMAAIEGHRVLLIDADPQGTATKFGALRVTLGLQPAFDFKAVSGSEAVVAAVSAAYGEYDHIFIDAGGRDNYSLRAALLASHVLVTPTQCSQFDCWELDTVASALRDVRKTNPNLRCLLVINNADTNPRIRLADETVDFAKDYPDFQVLDTRIGARIAFRYAASEGMSVCELPLKQRSQKAVDEITQLYKEVLHGTA